MPLIIFGIYIFKFYPSYEKCSNLKFLKIVAAFDVFAIQYKIAWFSRSQIIKRKSNYHHATSKHFEINKAFDNWVYLSVEKRSDEHIDFEKKFAIIP